MVGIALLTLVPGYVGGSEWYARNLLAALEEVGELDYRVLTNSLAPDAGAGLETVVARGYRVSGGRARRLASLVEAAARPGPLRAALGPVDLVHYPLTVPVPRTSAPSVLTLHDVQHLDLPSLTPRAERAYRVLAYDVATRRADRVIVLSEFGKRRALERLGLREDVVRVVHSGVDHERFRPGDDQREEFLLYPAKSWPHKNHARLFDAFALVRRERPDLRLVLTGSTLSAAPDGVEQRGLVSNDELVRLYRRAAALVFPSLYEGFGQPPLEAMASGCPVTCSDVASLPEIVGDAARLFDPRDTASIASGIRDVLDNSAEWSARGIARAREFSWDATARATEAVYRELL
ncbi:MAG TPA: glycosyltransferase family 1 protein [Gaiellaceae bacterium]|jgi:glycosyltransferase involved in cell wall biosynthesis